MSDKRNPVCPGCGWTEGCNLNHIPCVEKAQAERDLSRGLCQESLRQGAELEAELLFARATFRSDIEASEARIVDARAFAEATTGRLNREVARLQDRIAALEAERDALYERRPPCHEAEVAQKRYEEAEATIERLKVCGNCGRNSDIGSVGGLNWRCGTDEDTALTPAHPYDPCCFAPSCWAERSTP